MFTMTSPLSDTGFIEEYSELEVVKELSSDKKFIEFYNKTPKELFPDYLDMPIESWDNKGYVFEKDNGLIEVGLYRENGNDFCIEFLDYYDTLFTTFVEGETIQHEEEQAFEK